MSNSKHFKLHTAEFSRWLNTRATAYAAAEPITLEPKPCSSCGKSFHPRHANHDMCSRCNWERANTWKDAA